MTGTGQSLFVCACVRVGCTLSPKQGLGSPGAGITVVRATSCGWWGSGRTASSLSCWAISSSPFLVFQLRAFLALILRLGVIWFFSFCCCCSELGLLYYNYIQSVSFRTQSSSLFSDYASNFVYFGKTVVQPSVVLCYNEMLYVHTQTSQSPF